MIVRPAEALSLAMFLALAACGPRTDRTSDDHGSPPPSAGTSTSSAAKSADSSNASPWRANARGIGPVQVGMTEAEARSALGGAFPKPAGSGECAYVTIEAAPGAPRAMLVGGRIARLEVRDSAIATDRGARVGDTESYIQELYPGRVSVQPHKYTNGHYLVVTPAAPADSAFRIVFETDSTRVTQYRMGRLPEVEWVEGCS
jgi:hypothetical protein